MAEDTDFSALPQRRVNYEDAFVKYCGGLSLEDISLMLTIPLSKLEAHARNGQWPTLKARVEAQSQSLVPVHADEIARRAELIQQNRETNFRAWDKLRKDAMDVIDQLIETRGKNMITQLFHNKGKVVEHVRDLNISERATFANYLQVIAQGTYAALGDRVCSTGAKDDATSSPHGQPGITIILPGVISRPRANGDEKRVAGSDKPVPEDRVIDLRDV